MSLLCFDYMLKKAKKALKSILQKCTYLPALEPLLYEAPSNILKHVICQFSKVAGTSSTHFMRSAFVIPNKNSSNSFSISSQSYRFFLMTVRHVACLLPVAVWRKCRRSKQNLVLQFRNISMQSTTATLKRLSGSYTFIWIITNTISTYFDSAFIML